LHKQASWQLTATTINCDVVDDEATILVYKDWSVKCTGHARYASSREARGLLRKKSPSLGRSLECLGPECPKVIQYREKLLSEESRSGKTS
jgi:hypothetical protein